MSKIYKVKQDRIELMKGSRRISWIDLLKEDIQEFDWSYCNIEKFNNLIDAIHRFNELKYDCIATRKDGYTFPLILVYILQLEEVTINEKGEEEWEVYDEYIPDEEPELWDFENACYL